MVVKRGLAIVFIGVGIATLFSGPMQAQFDYWWAGDPVTRWQFGMSGAIDHWLGYPFYRASTLGVSVPRQSYPLPLRLAAPAARRPTYPSYDTIANHETCEAELFQFDRFVYLLRPGEGVRVRRNQSGWRVTLRVRTPAGNSEKRPGKLKPTDYGWEVRGCPVY